MFAGVHLASFFFGFLSAALCVGAWLIAKPKLEASGRSVDLAYALYGRLKRLLDIPGSRLVLAVGTGAMFLVTLFPSWIVFRRTPSGLTELPFGRGFLFTAQNPPGGEVFIRIDFMRLFLTYWAIGLGVLAVLILLQRRARPR